MKLFAVVEGKAVRMDVGEEGLLELRELCPIDIKQNSVSFAAVSLTVRQFKGRKKKGQTTKEEQRTFLIRVVGQYNSTKPRRHPGIE